MQIGLSEMLLGVLTLMLLAAAASDVRTRTISNVMNGAIALLAIPFWWSTGLPFWPDIVLQLAVALVVLAVFAVAFAMGAMGGGDVKMLAALALWLPAPAVLMLLAIMSIAGGVLTAAMLIRHRVARSGAALEIPYGVAIAFGGLWLISERFLYQFGG